MDARLQYFTTVDKQKLYYELWVPDKAEAIVVFVHGLGDHVGRYSEFAKALIKNNYGICMYDQRGHGRSTGRRAYAKSFSVFLKDLSQIIDLVQENYPHLPIFLAGHSFGGQVAINFIAKYSKGLRGLIAMSPNIEPIVKIPDWKIKTAKFLRQWLPIVQLSVDVDPAFFSHDEKVVDAAKNDPLINWFVTARLGADVLNNAHQLNKLAFQVKIPCLFMHGTDDRICSIEGTRRLYHSILIQNKEFKTYTGFYHELLNETGREKVFNDINLWLSNQLTSFKTIAGKGAVRAKTGGEFYVKENTDLFGGNHSYSLHNSR